MSVTFPVQEYEVLKYVCVFCPIYTSSNAEISSRILQL